MEGGQPAQRRKSKAARVFGWMGEHVAGTVLGFMVTAALTAGVVWVTGKDKTEGQRIDQVREEIAESGLEIKDFQEVTLHAGATSYLMTIGEPSEFEPDEVRIYDAEGSSLVQRFSFDPEIDSANSNVVAAPETFEILANRDVDGDGQSELIASYSLASATVFLQLPVTIAWDAAQRQYQLQPLLIEDPQPAPGNDPAARERLEPFKSPFIVTTKDGERFEAWAAESVALLDTPLIYAQGEPLYLGGAYPSPSYEDERGLAERKMQIAYWGLAIEPAGFLPDTHRLCWNNDLRLLRAEVGAGENEEDVIARSWNSLAREDELARRGESTGPEALYVGFVFPDGSCVLGE
ncbi:MAG TPA: hypothetical protein VLI94_10495 [Solirubrobacterales bacterium]|nr:hypothetical protein [Solirubrobacterales bacterium]